MTCSLVQVCLQPGVQCLVQNLHSQRVQDLPHNDTLVTWTHLEQFHELGGCLLQPGAVATFNQPLQHYTTHIAATQTRSHRTTSWHQDHSYSCLKPCAAAALIETVMAMHSTRNLGNESILHLEGA